MSDEEKILKKLQRQGLSLEDILRMGKAVKKGNPDGGNKYRIGKNNVKLGVLSDTHIGNIHYDKALMSHAGKVFSDEKVDAVLHGGDILDGWYQNRPQSLFEQNAFGLDQQVKMAVKELSKIEQPLYFITGNHEYNTFMRGAGVEVGQIDKFSPSFYPSYT